jgi:3',5'-cyclic AMP phosphodiesterase CpdA
MLRKAFLLLSVVFFILASCNQEKNPAVIEAEDSFTFAFLTDIHVQPERDAEAGFQAAIDKVNKIGPEFIITGGDHIMDALGVSYERADSLYNIYTSMIEGFNMPAYHTIGNHEIYGWYERSGADPDHPEFGKKMFEERIGKRYQVFEYKGWKFFILDSVEENGEGGYKGGIDSLQMAWIKEELARTDTNQPLVIGAHIPFVTVASQFLKGATAGNSPGTVITNAKQVIELFLGHNLKLVLQGHLHYLEDIYVGGIHFITAGAVSGGWWRGPVYRTEEGFLLVKVTGDELDWEYVDYGWEVAE